MSWPVALTPTMVAQPAVLREAELDTYDVWELWDAASGNAIADFETEAEALAAVRSLVNDGWKIDEILFMVDDPAWAVEDVPLAITGEELARKAGLVSESEARRTA
jgi:hypothetical protein